MVMLVFQFLDFVPVQHLLRGYSVNFWRDLLARLFVVRYVDIPGSLMRAISVIVVLVVLATSWALFEVYCADMLAFLEH